MFEKFVRKDGLAAVIAAGRRDAARHAELKKKLAAITPEWEELQSRCEQLQSALIAMDQGTWQTGASSSLWEARKVDLKARLAETCAARDLLTSQLEKEIASLSHHIQMRNQSLVNSFSGWFEAAKLPDELVGELKAVREFDVTGDTAELAGLIQAAVAKVSEHPSFGSGTYVNLPNWDRIGIAAASAAA